MIRTAVVGVGNFGKNHVRVVHQSERAQLAGIVEPDAARAEAAAKEYGCRVFPTLESLKGEVDAAVVAAPTNLHAAIGTALLEAGIDVLMEKPIVEDLVGVERLQ